MPDEEKVIGIDFLNTDEGGGMYVLCESRDGGENWSVVQNGRRIDGLLEQAKKIYPESIPMILPFQIREMLRYEILEERERLQIERLKKKEVQPIPSWWELIRKRFWR